MQIDPSSPSAEDLSEQVKKLSIVHIKTSGEWSHIFAVGDCANVNEIKVKDLLCFLTSRPSS
jgi:hypothetical protein